MNEKESKCAGQSLRRRIEELEAELARLTFYCEDCNARCTLEKTRFCERCLDHKRMKREGELEKERDRLRSDLEQQKMKFVFMKTDMAQKLLAASRQIEKLQAVVEAAREHREREKCYYRKNDPGWPELAKCVLCEPLAALDKEMP